MEVVQGKSDEGLKYDMQVRIETESLSSQENECGLELGDENANVERTGVELVLEIISQDCYWTR